jgi:hypothetical protein
MSDYIIFSNVTLLVFTESLGDFPIQEIGRGRDELGKTRIAPLDRSFLDRATRER